MMTQRLRIGILVERRYLSQTQPVGLGVALRAQGHQVTLIDPEAHSYEMGDERWLTSFDLIVARGRSWPLLSLLFWAEQCGVLTINGRAAITGVHNKADMALALVASLIPTPRTFLGPVEYLAGRVPQACYPLILKPMFGDNGRGLRLIGSPDELARLDWPEPVALAQQYLSSDGYDVKLYGIGDDIWVVRKPSLFEGMTEVARVRAETTATPTQSSSLQPPASSVELLPLTPRWQALGCGCRDLFGLELYGVDCLQTLQGPVVIEVNDFPNYTGVPDASKQLAEYIVRRARQEGAPR